MTRKISILLAVFLLCALAGGCSGEKSVSTVQPPSTAPESVTLESAAQALPEQNDSAPSHAEEPDVSGVPEEKTTLVLGGMNPENFLERIGGRYLRGMIDYEHAQCNLNTPEFREILQSALKAGRYEGGYDPDKNVPQRIVDGELICCYVGLSSALEVSFDRYRCGQTLGYIGFPTPDGSSGMDVRLMMPLGVSAATACPEGCWEFLKYTERSRASR